MTKEEIDIQKEIEKYFTESTGFGKDKIKNFMDIVNKALKQKGERIAELENKIADIKANCDYVLEGKEIEYREERKKLCADFENMKATLESKIAELKGIKDIATLIRANNDTVVTLMQLNNKLVNKNQQLTKAKELLQRFIKWARTENCEKFDVILADTEQFLKCENIILEDAQAGNSPFDADEVFNKEMKAYPEEK